jgi:NitT/TauT family transport system substrate-binding protein
MRNWKQIKSRSLAIACAVGVALGSGVVAASSASAATDVVVGVNAVGTNAQVQYAIDQGIFTKNGLNVTTMVSPSPPQLVQMLQAGQIQYMYIPFANALTARTNGNLDIKIVAPANGISANDAKRMKTDKNFAKVTDPSSFCVSKTSGITRGRDLEGKTVAIGSRGGLSELAFSEYIRNDGGDPSKVKWTIAGMKLGMDLVKQGNADAAYGTTPFNTYCETLGLDILTQADYQIDPNGGPVAAWIATSKYIAENPAAVKAFQKSMAEAAVQLRLRKNHDAFYEAASKMTRQPVESFKATKMPVYFTSVSRADVQTTADALLRNGLVKQPVDVNGILLTQYR